MTSRLETTLPATAPNPLSRADAVRFLQRATYGGRPGDDTALIASGVDAWFAAQVTAQPVETHFNRTIRKDVGTARAYWEGVFTGTDHLRKRVAYALSQIFVISDREVEHESVAAYADMLEANAFGTFRQLLEEVTLSHAMGRYLTYRGNRKADPRRGRVPDENYAREVMQLFTIGLWQLNPDGTRALVAGEPVPTYGQDDILGLARVFTGWRDNSDVADPYLFTTHMVMRERDHEPGTKTFLGTTIPQNTPGYASLTIALDTLANHANVGPFFSRQMIQRLVTSNPSSAYVARVAAVFANDGTGQRGNLEATIRAILTDDEAWQTDPPQSFGKLREPVLRFTVVVRALGVSAVDNDWRFYELEDPSRELGQQPFLAPSVFNFYRPGYVPPQTALSANGLVGPEFQIANESSAIGWVNWLGRTLRSPHSSTQYDIAPLIALTNNVSALVTEVAARLCPSGLSTAVREAIERNVANIASRNVERQQLERVMGTVLMVAASTDFLHER